MNPKRGSHTYRVTKRALGKTMPAEVKVPGGLDGKGLAAQSEDDGLDCPLGYGRVLRPCRCRLVVIGFSD